MEYIALTGISERVISELRQNRLLTIEIRSPNNFLAALRMNVGEMLFLTHTSAEDLTGGSMGIITKLVRHQVSTHRVMQSNEAFYEERETTSLRLQLDPNCIARVRKVLNNTIGEVTKVDAEEIPLYNAR
ncbi:hypothetical protein MettiDRAFT_1818 [Methanolobus tindarius DSM 2278]|uniref:DUF473 domain-containing protein n=1 Tax=Methanolobus tindarius DSM 2278 TaxID=1090322 RepID=W9DY57_METTI|nr:DUF473 domain-containing protein [Methanolobus tindarius]ETA68351.1 hypothetical protein MettiDRAFT_1818 [Methanolobus tindarius DSM 2278]